MRQMTCPGVIPIDFPSSQDHCSKAFLALICSILLNPLHNLHDLKSNQYSFNSMETTTTVTDAKVVYINIMLLNGTKLTSGKTDIIANNYVNLCFKFCVQ